MKILMACEYSGRVRQAMKARGHDVTSVDLLPSEDGSPDHIVGDMVPVIQRGWDLLIMHPPCTALACSGNRWYGTGMPKHQARVARPSVCSD